MKNTLPRLLAQVGTLSMLPLALGAAEAGKAGPTYKTSGTVTTTVGFVSVEGSDAAYRAREGRSGNIYGGIEDLAIEATDGDSLTATVSGHLLFDEGDYLLKTAVVKDGLGRFELEFRNSRSWSNGTGGVYVRPNGTVVNYSLADPALELERTWLRAKAILQRDPDAAKLTIAYEFQQRDGLKSSTHWADTSLTGITGATRNIVPSFYDIDEKRHAVSADLEGSLGKVDLKGGARFETTDVNDSRKIRRRPTESSDRKLTHTQGNKNDLFSSHGAAEYRPNETWLFSTSASIFNLDGDLTGSRIYGATYDAVFDPLLPTRQGRDEGYIDMVGTSNLREYAWNAGALYTPSKNWAVAPAVMVKRYDLSSTSRFEETAVGTTSARVTAIDEIEAESGKKFDEIATEIEVRYSGFKRLNLYARAEASIADGHMEELALEDGHTVMIDRLTDFTRDSGKIAAGFNYVALDSLRFAGQVYTKENRNNYDFTRDNTPNTGSDRYPNLIRKHYLMTDGAFIRATCKILPTLTSISRVDVQKSKIESAAYTRPVILSGDHDVTIYSQSLSWMATNRLHLQATASLTDDNYWTPGTTLTGSVANEVQEGNNDWVSTDLSATYVLSDSTDVNVSGFYMKAANYVPNYSVSYPFGAGFEEYGGKVSLVHRFSANLIGTIQYGYVDSKDEASLGLNDYEAHAISTKIECRF